MQVISAAWRGSQGGTGIPEHSEDMPGKSLNEGGMVNNLCIEFKNKFCQEYQPEKQEKEICRMHMQW